MKEFDYTIIGGGCAGLSLAYELEINNKLSDKTLAIIEPRTEYQRDKTWSFWKTFPHNFEDCVIKSWDSFSINIPNKSKQVECESLPYQSVEEALQGGFVFPPSMCNQGSDFKCNLSAPIFLQ